MTLKELMDAGFTVKYYPPMSNTGGGEYSVIVERPAKYNASNQAIHKAGYSPVSPEEAFAMVVVELNKVNLTFKKPHRDRWTPT